LASQRLARLETQAQSLDGSPVLNQPASSAQPSAVGDPGEAVGAGVGRGVGAGVGAAVVGAGDGATDGAPEQPQAARQAS